MNKNRIKLTESQLRQIVKESVNSILKEGSKKKDPMSQWFNDFNKASKFRETMDYVNKGGRNPLSELFSSVRSHYAVLPEFSGIFSSPRPARAE